MRPARILPACAAMLLALAPAPSFAAPEVQARLSAGSIEAGTSVTLIVKVTNPAGGTRDPDVVLPAGITVLGSDRSQNFSFVNGRGTTEIESRYELAAETPGSYSIGPIRVRIGSQVYVCPAMPLVVTAARNRPRAGPAGSAPATLVVELSPRRPYVGQLSQLSLRLVQTENIQQSGANSAPATPGFWSEAWGEPIEYRGHVGARAAAVTERRVRVYPLAAGTATIGSASLLVIPAGSGSLDPFLSGGLGARPVQISSESLHVSVAPLPPGAPPEFENAVGEFSVEWSLDRGHTTQDQAVTLHLDVRGAGNLPLLHTPSVALEGFDVFASTVDDSFAPLGDLAPGRRRFQWTLLAHRTGILRIPPIAYAWFNPRTGSYAQAHLPPLTVEVLASGPAPADPADAAFPPELARRPSAPGSRAARGWMFALAGLALGAAVRLARRPQGADPEAAERARAREFLRVVGLANGPDFWHAADDSAAWLEARGVQVMRLREDISVARFSGATANQQEIRRRLIERLGEAMPAPPQPASRVGLAAVLALVAIALLIFGRPVPGEERLAQRARAADAAARGGRTAAAVSDWRALWREAPGDGPLAARLAWAALRAGDVAEASLWTLRGENGDAREPALRWVGTHVREAGGLVGSTGHALPLRVLEWALLAFALAAGAGLAWPRRARAATLAALALLCAFASPYGRLLEVRQRFAVVVRTTPMVHADLELEPGQVVHVRSVSGAMAHVRAGRGVEGDVAREALIMVNEGGR